MADVTTASGQCLDSGSVRETRTNPDTDAMPQFHQTKPLLAPTLRSTPLPTSQGWLLDPLGQPHRKQRHRKPSRGSEAGLCRSMGTPGRRHSDCRAGFVLLLDLRNGYTGICSVFIN